MTQINFTVPGAPVGKGRARSATRKGKGGRTFIAHITPEKTANYESLIALAGHQAMAGAPPLEQACAVRLEIYVPVPASWSKKKQARALSGEVLPTTKPDIDNVEKAIFDGLNGVIWKDDVQVTDVIKKKRYSDTPRVEVTVEPRLITP
jgi:Holliday junction resolvase RusA-like endonuclease